MPKNSPKTESRYVVEEIEISLIDYEEQQVRSVQIDDEIHELASSIDALDLLQFPGVIRQPDGRFELAWGRRRLEAFRLQKKTKIPCRIYVGDRESIKALALVENMQRRQMSIEEECKGVAHLVLVRKLSVDQIVSQLGRTRTWVLHRLAIPNYPPEIREALLSQAVNLGVAEEIASLNDESQRAYILNAAVYQKLTLGDVRAMVKAARSSPDTTEAVQIGLAAARAGFVAQRQLIECAGCGTPQPVEDLVYVRVCARGCTANTEETKHERAEEI
jgi:ParB family chromosome partitioning protein